MAREDNRLIVGIDVDGVLADFNLRYTEVANAMFGKPAIGALPVDWDMSNYGLTKEQDQAVWERIQSTPNFWIDLKPLAPAEDLSDYQDDMRLFFITSRAHTLGMSVDRQTKLWLSHHYGIDMPDVIVTNRKGLLAKALELDAFIDDKPENCEKVANSSKSTLVRLKDASHNQHLKPVYLSGVLIPRVRDIKEFFENVQGTEDARRYGPAQAA